MILSTIVLGSSACAVVTTPREQIECDAGCAAEIAPPMLTFVSHSPFVVRSRDGSYTIAITVTWVDDYELVTAFDFTSDPITLADAPLPLAARVGHATLSIDVPYRPLDGTLHFVFDVVSASGLVSQRYTDSILVY
jgi:hypothetical protein